MARQLANEFLVKKYGAENVQYLGGGSDSVAFRVGDRVFRFTGKSRNIYVTEAAICNFLRPYISVEIPDIKIHDAAGMFYAEHKMITGVRWSWHKFQFQPRRQRNLANTCAEFLAQLHGVDTAAAIDAIPELKNAISYVSFDEVAPFMREIMGPRTLRFFRRHYEKIINQPVPARDMVIVHMGLKGANSVCWDDGRLRGVYDFGNAGIYERGRDLVLFSLSKNRRFYNTFLRRYQKLTGVNINRRRIADLAKIEFLWKKRWMANGKVVMVMGRRRLKRQVASALLHFCGLPKFGLRPIVYCALTLHERAQLRRNAE